MPVSGDFAGPYRILTEYGKIRTGKIPNTDIFKAVGNPMLKPLTLFFYYSLFIVDVKYLP